MVGRQVVVEEGNQILDLAGVVLDPEGAGPMPQDPRGALVAARGARPIPRSMRPGWSVSSIRNCSATLSAL